MFHPDKCFGIIKQVCTEFSLEVIAALTRIRTTDIDSGEVKHLFIAIPEGVEIESVGADIAAVSGMVGERSVTKSFVGSMTVDILYDTLVKEKNYLPLIGPKIKNVLYVRPPCANLDAHRYNSSVKEYMDIANLPEDIQ